MYLSANQGKRTLLNGQLGRWCDFQVNYCIIFSCCSLFGLESRGRYGSSVHAARHHIHKSNSLWQRNRILRTLKPNESLRFDSFSPSLELTTWGLDSSFEVTSPSSFPLCIHVSSAFSFFSIFSPFYLLIRPLVWLFAFSLGPRECC